MWRSLLIVLMAAALGSLVATVGLRLRHGTDAFEPTRLIFAIAGAAMIFTVPGARMLAGVQAILSGRGLGGGHRDALVALIGAVAGAAILAFISPPMAGVGAAYGLATAVAFICLQWLVAGAGEPST